MIRSHQREGRTIRGGLFFDRGMATYEVSWGRLSLGAKVSTRGEETIDVAARLGLATVYLSATVRRQDGRDVRLWPFRADVDLYKLDHDLWLRVDLGEYDRSHARGARFHLITHTGRLKDRLLGRQKYAVEVVQQGRSIIPLPEGGMPCSITWERATWKRPRWPRTTSIVRADVTPDSPVGTPGKGENPWDCGPSATHSVSGPVKTLTEREAVVMFATSVLRDRERYGGALDATA